MSSAGAAAKEETSVLLLDDSASSVSGARHRLGFERFPIGEEKPIWIDPTGTWDSTGIALLTGGGLIGAGFGDAHAQEQRNASIELLRTAVEQGKRLQTAIDGAVRASASSHGFPIDETFVAHSVSEGFVLKAIPGEGTAVMVKRQTGMQLVTLSWDNRQPLLAFDVRRLLKREGVRLPVREQFARELRYVGYPAPDAANAVEYWAKDDAHRFMSEVEIGLAAMLPLAWSTDLKVPSASRKDRVTLRVGDEQLEFPGRLWKQEAGLAYIANSDDGITIVHVQPPSEILPAAPSSQGSAH
jgi:hypothetical protein